MKGGMSYREIGDVLGISGVRVRQIEATALRKLRRSGKLEKFLLKCIPPVRLHVKLNLTGTHPRLYRSSPCRLVQDRG